MSIGPGSAVLDCATVVATRRGGRASVGASVTIQAGAYVESAAVQDGAMVGSGARVLAGSVVERDAFVDAGAVVAPGTRVSAGYLWTGNPARPLRTLTEEEMAYLRSTAAAYSDLGARHGAQDRKTLAEVDADDLEHEFRVASHLSPSAVVEEVDADVQAYYKLSEMPPDRGIFRATEWDDDEAEKRREAEEKAADDAEDAYYAQLASLSRADRLIKDLATVPPGRAQERDALLAEALRRDPNAVAYVRDLMQRAADLPADWAASPQPAPGSALAQILEELAAIDAYKGARAGFQPRLQIEALRAHAPALLAASAARA